MGWLKQLGILFWKNYLVRKRQPVIVVLEVIWPVLMFVVIGLMRSGSPPTEKETCSYPERALPSAGMVPFLQSSVCTLSNTCQRSEQILEKANAQQRLRSMIDEISPLLSKNTTVEAIKSLPTLTLVISAIENVTNGTNIEKLDDKLKLRTMFNDADVMVYLLTDKYKIMSVKEAGDLLDSSLNAVQFFKAVGFVDFKGIACDPNQLSKYILFEKEVDVDAISKSICAIDDTLISNITNDVARQLDVANLIRLGEDFAGMTGAVDYAVMMEDIAKLVDLYMNSSNLIGALTDMADFTAIPDLISKMSSLFPMMDDLQNIDFASLDALYVIIDPMLRSLTNDSGISEALKQVLTIGESLTTGSDTDLMTMLKDIMPLVQQLGNSSFSETLGPILEQVPFTDIANILGMLMNGTNTEDPTSMIMDSSSRNMEVMLETLVGNSSKDVMGVVDSVMGMMEDTMSFTTDMGEELKYTIANNAETKEVMNQLAAVGQEKANEFLLDIVKTDNFYNILTGDLDMNTLCVDTAKKVLADMTSAETAEFTSNVCVKSLTDEINSVMGPLKYEAFTTKMQSSVQEMNMRLQGTSSTPVNSSMTEMNTRVTNIITRATTAMQVNTTDLWSNVLAGTNMDYQWYEVWNNVGQQYMMQSNLMLPVVLMGESMESSVIWTSVGPQVYLVDATLESFVNVVKKVEDISKEGKALHLMVTYLEYMPEVMDAMAKQGADINKLAGIISLNFTNMDQLSEFMCDAIKWDTLEVSSNVPIDEIKAFICTSNWTYALFDTLTAMNPLDMLADLERVVNNNTQMGIDWSRMIGNVQHVFDMFSTGYNSAFIQLWSRAQLDVAALMTTLEKSIGFLFNMTAEQTASFTSDLSTQMESLDMALQEMQFWNRAKRYISMWMSMAKLQHAYLEEVKATGVNMIGYINGLSPTLGKFLNDSVQKLPKLIEGLQSTLTQQQKIMDMISMMEMGSLCSNGSISDLLGLSPTSEVAMFEKDVCQLNWTLIENELWKNNEIAKLQSDIEKVIVDDMSTVVLNWTEVLATAVTYFNDIGVFYSTPIDTHLPQLDMEKLNASLTNVLQNAMATDATSLSGLANGMDQLLTSLFASNDSISMALQYSIGMQSYLNYHTIVFFRKQLEYLNSTDNVDIKQYLNSEVLNDWFNLYDNAAELNEVFINNLLDMMQDSSKITKLVSNIGTLCSDTSVFASIFVVPADSNITVDEVRTMVCGANVDGEKLLTELKTSLDGFEELVNAMSGVFDGSITTFPVNYTVLVKEYDLYVKLLESVIADPPMFTLPWLSPEEELQQMLKQLEKLGTSLNNSYMGEQTATMQTVQGQVYQSLMSLQYSIPGMDTFLQILNLYAALLERMISEGKMADEAFDGYPEMKKIVELMDSLPELYSTFTYTTYMDPMKISTFTSTLMVGLETLCTTNPNELMTVPPGITFDFAAFMNTFCTINMTHLQHEYNNFTDAATISGLWADLYNNTVVTTPTTNLTEAFKRFESLMAGFNDVNNVTLPRFMNTTLWTESMDFVSNLLMNSSALLQTMQTVQGQVYQSLMSLQYSIPGMDTFLQILNLYAALLERMISEGKTADEAFDGYPEMKKIVELMDSLPELYSTFTYTTYMDPMKISTFTSTLMMGLETLCTTNPNELMTVPPGSTFNFAAFVNTFCTINMTNLQHEYNNFTDAATISGLWADLYNSTVVATPTTNLTEVFMRFQSLMASFNDVTSMTLPRFMNATLWDESMEFVSNLLMNSTALMQSLLDLQQGQIYQQIVTLQMSVPGTDTFLQILNMYAAILERMVAEGQLLSQGTSFAAYPALEQLWKLMDSLPELYHTYMYTFYTDPSKISTFTESIAMGLPQLCSADPATLMTVPPESTFDFASFFSSFCSINMTNLETEYNNFTNAPAISELWGALYNTTTVTTTTNVAALLQRYASLATEVSDLFNTTTDSMLPRFMNTSLWIEVTNDINTLLMNTAALMQSPNAISMASLPMEITKVVATIDVVLDLVIDRLHALSENVTLEGLTRNSSYLIAMLGSIGRLNNLKDVSTLNTTIDQEKILMVLAQPDLLMQLCGNGTFADYVSPTGSRTEVSTDLQNIMCIDPTAFVESLQNIVSLDEFAQKLNDIWNNTGAASPAGWQSVTTKVETLTNILVKFMESPPGVSSEIMNWLDFNSTLNFLSTIYADPKLFSGLPQMFGLSGETTELMNLLMEGMMPLFAQLQDINIETLMNNPEKLTAVIESLGSVEKWMNAIVQGYNKFMLTHAGESEEMALLVCITAEIESWSKTYGPLSKPVSTVKNAVCGIDSAEWYDKLVDSGFTAQDIMIIQRTFTRMSNFSLSDETSNFVTALDIIMDSLASMDAVVNLLSTNQTLESSLMNIQDVGLNGMMALLKILEDDTFSELNEIFTVMVTVQKHIYQRFEDLANSGSAMTLRSILPDSNTVAALLEDMIGAPSTAQIMVATINPEQFMTLLVSGQWNVTVCDINKFRGMFTFPDGTDVELLQQDLCAQTLSKGTDLSNVIDTLDIGDILKEVEAALSNTSVVNMTKLLTDFSSYTSKILGYMTNTSIDLGAWFEPIIKVLEGVNDQNTEQMIRTCNATVRYMENTAMFQDVIKPYLYQITTFEEITRNVLSIEIDVDNIVCRSDQTNLTSLVMMLMDKNVPDRLQWLAERITSQDTDMEFSCEKAVTSYASINELMTTAVGILTNNTNTTLECIGNMVMRSQHVLTDITRLLSLGTEAMKILEDPQLQKLLQTASGSDEIVEVINSVVELYSQQQTALSSVEKALTQNITDVETYFKTTFEMSQESVAALVNSTLGLDLANMSAEELVNEMCKSGVISSAFGLNDGSLNLTLLYTTLCGPDREMSVSVADNLLRLADLATKINELPSSDTDAIWKTFTTDISELVKNIEGLSQLAGMVNSLSDIDITNLGNNTALLSTLQRILVDNGPDDLLTSLNAILDNFKLLDDSKMTNDVIQDAKIIANGIFAFQSLRNTFIKSIEIKDVVKDQAVFHAYMTQTLNISPEVADAIIDGVLSFEMLLSAAQPTVSDWVCNSTNLAKLIKVQEDSQTDPVTVSGQFCKLSSSTISKLLDDVMMQLDIGGLMEELALNGLSSIVSSANVTIEETTAALNNLKLAQGDIQSLLKTVDNFTAAIPNAVASLAQAQKGSFDMTSLSALICGDPIAEISDDLSVNTVVSPAIELTDEETKDMESLPGEVCQDMYRDIMKDENGPIIWGYLKPLVRGKILFAPNSPVVMKLIQKINTTFSSLEDASTMAEEWAKGSLFLEDLSGDQTSDIQNLMKSPLVQGMLTEVSGVSVADLESMLYSFNSTDAELMASLTNVAQMASDYVKCIELDRFVGFASEDELMAEAAKLHDTNNLLAGIYFTNVPGGAGRLRRDVTSSGLPRHVKYELRMDIDNVAHTNRIKSRMWRPVPEDNFGLDLRYLRGFIQLQDMIDTAIISMQTGSNETQLPSVTTKQFPFPCHKVDTFINAFTAYLLPVVMTVAWIAGLSVAVNNLVYDREQGQEETLRAMGMKTVLNWWSWFISTMFTFAIVALLCVFILHFWNIFSNSNFGIIYLYFIDFLFSSLMLCYFVSAFFTRTSLAILASLIVYLISFLPFAVLLTLEVQMEFWQKTLACLSSTTAFSFAATFIARYEEQQIGIQWSNIQESPVAGDEFSFSWTCFMMLIDGCIYMVIGWYVRNVKPGKYGVSEPWYFPVSPYYWGCSDSADTRSKYRSNRKEVFSEDFTTDHPVVMSVNGLSKEYTRGKPVVKNLSLDIHAGNITTLLGHNGAAKTTTINMLIGLLEPTQGQVSIFNRSIKHMRQSIGVCPQHNSLFEYMTVQEHMEFYSSIKSSHSSKERKHEIKELLKDLDLYFCRFSKVKELSGGMKRKLCVALAFVGESKAIILDEPTSGVDPSGRRLVWNLIIRRTSGAAILLSTHHLDEADMISDRIAIMHQGNLLCHGSPIFLKQHLAVGHRLIITKDPQRGDNDPTAILACVRQRIPEAKLQQIAGHDLTFVLPTVNSKYFCDVFHDLEAYKDKLNVLNYGISDPTLEEVFLKTCTAADLGRPINPDTVKYQDFDSKAKETNEWKHDMEQAEPKGNPSFLKKTPKVSGANLTIQQFGAILTKRFHHYRRNWRMFMSVFLLPLILFLTASGLYSVKPSDTKAVNLLLSPAMYGPNTYVFAKQDSSHSLADSIVKTFMENPGIGTSCMAGMDLSEPFECVDPDTTFTTPTYDSNDLPNCTCNDYSYTCQGDGAGIPPRQRKTPTTDILQDLQGRNIEEYLMESFHAFIEKRYGGWSFHDGVNNSKLEALVWFNNKGHHALTSFYNAYSNGLLRSMINENDHGPASEYGITTYNNPFLFTKEQLSRDTLYQNAADVGIAVTILLAFTFLPVGLVMYMVMENVNKDKHLQSVSGIGTTLYWITSLFWDLLILIIGVAFAFAIMAIFRHDSFWARNNAPAAVCLILFYGWATIPLMYCTVKLFKSVSAAFITQLCILTFLGVFCVTLMLALNYFQNNDNGLADVHNALKYIFLVFPSYALAGGMVDMITNQIKTNIFERFGADVYVEPFTFDLIGWNLLVMGTEGLVFFILAIVIDFRKPCSSTSSKYHSVGSEDACEDADVLQERQRIQQRHCRDDIVIVNDLHKVYSGADNAVHAVNGVSFGVPQGQCFGLLGVNGAGKTTTFNILTGALDATSGKASLLGKSVKQGSTALGHNMGYCPQEEALDPFLSIEETLHFHCKLKGISSENRKQTITKVMDTLKLHRIKNKVVKACSGGMKRKLSLAIALLGDPYLVLLDEPTTGMDPKAKRLVWDCIISAKEQGQAIIITSHSMEECDILCDRISIMVNGQFKCIGSSQHLKHKFGEGYTVTLNVCGLSNTKSRIYDLMQRNFPGTLIRDQNQNVIQLDIPKSTHKVADIFDVLEREKHEYNIMYYTVSQTTLETVFLNFANEQGDGTSTEEGTETNSSTAESYSDTPLAGHPLSDKGFYGYMNRTYDNSENAKGHLQFRSDEKELREHTHSIRM